jgi:pimeloyl-ACP methyl ester carboxylesterase
MAGFGFMAFVPGLLGHTKPVDPLEGLSNNNYEIETQVVKFTYLGNTYDTGFYILGKNKSDFCIKTSAYIVYSCASLEYSLHPNVLERLSWILQQLNSRPRGKYHYKFILWDYPGYGSNYLQTNIKQNDNMLSRLYRWKYSIPDYYPILDEGIVSCCVDAVLKQILSITTTQPLVLWGRSIGAYATSLFLKKIIDEGKQIHISGIIYESPLKSIWSYLLINKYFQCSSAFMPFDGFDSAPILMSYTQYLDRDCKVIFLHHINDNIISIDNSWLLAACVSGEKEVKVCNNSTDYPHQVDAHEYIELLLLNL